MPVVPTTSLTSDSSARGEISLRRNQPVPTRLLSQCSRASSFFTQHWGFSLVVPGFYTLCTYTQCVMAFTSGQYPHL